MDVIDCAMEIPEEPLSVPETLIPENLAAAAAHYEVNNLFDVLAQAELEHHDALVELTGNLNLQRAQFRLPQGKACLFKTAPGKA
jgi:hypothetical protein